jgi:two-component system phosphate regulon response regulator OmpR|tara:strand:+ start:11924 stop:12628 length:705 start_codon:yes stop_codon:yes gene_type:complete
MARGSDAVNADLPHLLVVDDDGRLRDLLSRFLTENGFVVVTAADAAQARSRLSHFDFDAVILDLMMPGETGLEFARDLRTRSAIPILMLTAMAETEDRISGLEGGADDYVVKPFEPRELLLRIRNIMKRTPQAQTPGDDLHLGDFLFRRDRGELLRDGRPVRLTDLEAGLLSALAARPGDVLTRDDLIARTGAAGGGRAVDVQVTRLRRKIEPDPRDPRYLQTVRGKGYVLRPD